MSEGTINFNGVELTPDQVKAKMAEFQAMQKQFASLKKEAKAKGIVVEKATKEAKEKSAEYQLIVASFAPVIEANASQIESLFLASRTDIDDATTGNDSISFDVSKEYHVIIRSKSVTSAKKKLHDANKKPTVTKEQEDAAERAQKGEI